MRWRKPGLHSKTQSQKIGGGEGKRERGGRGEGESEAKKKTTDKKVTTLYKWNPVIRKKKRKKKASKKKNSKCNLSCFPRLLKISRRC